MTVTPQEDAFTRLKPSPIHGVGVFAIRPIAKGSCVFSADRSSFVWVSKKRIEDFPVWLKQLYDDFYLIKSDDNYACPTDFNHLTVLWYLNHADNPNVQADHALRFFALRDIDEGEELTANYFPALKGEALCQAR